MTKTPEIKTNTSKDSINLSIRSVESFLNTELKDHAKYVIETRAMPNIMDGLRIGARKILWATLTGDLKKSSKVKMPSLIGDSMKVHYNHGDASLLNTIIQLASTHIYQYAPLTVIGQIGTLRNPDCDTAPRYLNIKTNEYLNFFKTDLELIEQEVEEGDKIQPKFFLPLIPIVLLWKTNSPGFGFSFRSFSYNINSIIDNCIQTVKYGTCTTGIEQIPLIPYIEGIKPENMIFNSNKNSWYNVGEYTINEETDTIIINDLPFDVSFDKYEEHLQLLVDENYIVSYNDMSMDGKIRYIIKFSKGRIKTLLNADKWKFFQRLKLFSKITKDTLNVIDVDGKTILNFNTGYELIDYFVKKRLEFYNKRKTRTISIIKDKITDLSNKIKFIDLVITDKLIINKRKISDIKDDLDKNSLPIDMLKLNIDKLTEDEILKMQSEIIELNKNLEYINNTSISEMYVKDLVEFKNKYIGIQQPQIN